MKLTIAASKKIRFSFPSLLAKPPPWRIDKKTKNPRLLAQWEVVNGKLQCRWFMGRC